MTSCDIGPKQHCLTFYIQIDIITGGNGGIICHKLQITRGFTVFVYNKMKLMNEMHIQILTVGGAHGKAKMVTPEDKQRCATFCL